MLDAAFFKNIQESYVLYASRSMSKRRELYVLDATFYEKVKELYALDATFTRQYRNICA